MEFYVGLIITFALAIIGYVISIFYSAKKKTNKNILNIKKNSGSIIKIGDVHIGDGVTDKKTEKQGE